MPVEVVPGVSSAVAVPAAAGIPVTHRGLASSFAVVTGHEDPAKPAGGVDWERLATAVDTLVMLMGVGTLPAHRRAAHGRRPRCPPRRPPSSAAATTAAQGIVTGTLATSPSAPRHLPSPAVIVIGEVVRLAEDDAVRVEAASRWTGYAGAE